MRWFIVLLLCNQPRTICPCSPACCSKHDVNRIYAWALWLAPLYMADTQRIRENPMSSALLDDLRARAFEEQPQQLAIRIAIVHHQDAPRSLTGLQPDDLWHRTFTGCHRPPRNRRATDLPSDRPCQVGDPEQVDAIVTHRYRLCSPAILQL